MTVTPLDSEFADAVSAIAQRLAQSRRALFITGAGVSADSGLPTYRGINGLYNETATEDGISIEEALSGDMLRAHPDITWKHLAHIEAGCRGAQPNAAHHIIAELEQRLPHVLVLTQNIDGLHLAAGSRNLIEIHGNLHHLSCTDCGQSETIDDLAGRALPPRCPACGALVRPDVVLFGEMLGEHNLSRLYRELEQGFDIVFSIGTSSVFPYIAEPVVRARRAGVPTVEINPDETRLSPYVDYRLPVGAAAAMQAIIAAWPDGAA